MDTKETASETLGRRVNTLSGRNDQPAGNGGSLSEEEIKRFEDALETVRSFGLRFCDLARKTTPVLEGWEKYRRQAEAANRPKIERGGNGNVAPPPPPPPAKVPRLKTANDFYAALKADGCTEPCPIGSAIKLVCQFDRNWENISYDEMYAYWLEHRNIESQKSARSYGRCLVSEKAKKGYPDLKHSTPPPMLLIAAYHILDKKCSKGTAQFFKNMVDGLRPGSPFMALYGLFQEKWSNKKASDNRAKLFEIITAWNMWRNSNMDVTKEDLRYSAKKPFPIPID
ncbi:MAG: hypothetical protein ACYST6_16570 [Planctomycetota bacterium]|jgi:hypothetical protein